MKLISLNPDLKIILMSAYENITYNTSRFTFLSKPISIAQLLKVIKEFLDEQPKLTSKLEWTHDTEYNVKFTNIIF